MFWFFGCEACVLAPRPGIKLSPPALEGEVLTTEPPQRAWLLGFRLESLGALWSKYWEWNAVEAGGMGESFQGQLG